MAYSGVLETMVKTKDLARQICPRSHTGAILEAFLDLLPQFFFLDLIVKDQVWVAVSK